MSTPVASDTMSHSVQDSAWGLEAGRGVICAGFIRLRKTLLVGVALVLLVVVIVSLQQDLDRRGSNLVATKEQLRALPSGEVLKPLLLGYRHIGADLLWLQVIQVLGPREVPMEDYEWAAHALDVITTLDPQFVYAYDAGGVVLSELAGQVEGSNRLLRKGIAENPTAWRLPFQLGFNLFFHQQDYQGAAEAMATAARLPGRPAYVPELAARLYAEAKNPDLAMAFLASVRATTQDPLVLASLDRRRDEAVIERDLLRIEHALAAYADRFGGFPSSLPRLVEEGLLMAIPQEPFGGEYRLDRETGQVSSSTHPRRLRIYRPQEIQSYTSAAVTP